MDLHFVSIYRVHGISKLPDEQSRQVWQSADAEAFLTTELEEVAYHPDRSSALIHGLMAGLVGEKQSGPVEERIAARVAEIRRERAKRHSNAVFFVFRATREIEPVVADIKHDAETFTLAFDAIDKKVVFNEYLPALLRALSAVLVGIDSEATASISKVTQASFLIDHATGRPTYSVTMEAGAATISLAKVPDDGVFERIDRNARALESDDRITRVLDLFIQSLSGDFDEFRSFLSAWSALEIFVSSSFKQIYSERWFYTLESAAPESAAEYFTRLRGIMSERHRLTDKFVVIASLLNDVDPDADIAQFRNLKTRRDAISHGTDDSIETYPVIETQQLLRKYLALHLAR